VFRDLATRLHGHGASDDTVEAVVNTSRTAGLHTFMSVGDYLGDEQVVPATPLRRRAQRRLFRRQQTPYNRPNNRPRDPEEVETIDFTQSENEEESQGVILPTTNHNLD